MPVAGADTDAEALAIIAAAYPGREVVAGARGGPRLRRRRPALHHPAGSGARVAEQPAARARPRAPARRRAPARPSARRCASAWSRSAGTPIPTSTRRRWRAGIRMAAARGRADRLPAGAHPVAVLRDHPGRAAAGRRRARGARDRADGRASPAELAAETGVHVHASLYERADGRATASATTRRSWSRPTGTLVSRTRKLHIPVTAGYYEDRYFRPGPAGEDAFPLIALPTEDGDGGSSAARPAGTSGSPSWPGPTRSRAPRC